MTRQQKVWALHRLRDVLFDLAVRRWQEEGWVVKPHMECRETRHGKRAALAVLDEDEHVCHVYSHPTEKDQPVAKTMLHEVVGHILLGLEGQPRDERAADKIEDLLWPILTPQQKAQLSNLVGPLA